MGILHQKKLLYVSQELQFTHIVAILCELAKDQRKEFTACCGPTERDGLQLAPSPSIIIDANQMGMKMLNMPGSPMLRIIAFVQKFAKEGIDVIIAADGTMQMHTKWASIQQAGNWECAHITALTLKQELAIHLQSNNINNEKIAELQKIVMKMESSTNNMLLDDFIDVLREEVDCLKTQSLSGDVTLIIAQYQADPMIAQIILEGKVDAVISNNLDYAVYLGQKCLYIKEYSYKIWDGSIDKIILSTGDKFMADWVDECLRKLFCNVNCRFWTPKFPLFQERLTCLSGH